MAKKIFVVSDHAGLELKNKVAEYVKELGYDVEDCGPYELDPNDDYPDLIIPAAKKIAQDPNNLGIILGGSGQGEAIAANKVNGIRAVIFYGPIKATKAIDVKGNQSEDPYEILKLTKIHNNANVLSIGERFIDQEIVKKAAKIWLETDFKNEERHKRRVQKITDYENGRD